MARSFLILSVAAAVLLGSGISSYAASNDPLPGIDILIRKEPICPCTYPSFGSPDLPAIPADFFGPGSDPFVGTVGLEYLDSQSGGGTVSWDYLEGATPNVLDVQMEELSLQSIEPILVTNSSGGTDLYDLTISISLDGLPPGEPVVRTVEIPPGEAFNPGTSNFVIESSLTIVYEIDFTESGTGNPAGSTISDFLQLEMQDIDLPIFTRLDGTVVLGSTDGLSTLPVTYASAGGGFVLAIQSVPEPTSILMALLACLGCLAMGRQRPKGNH